MLVRRIVLGLSSGVICILLFFAIPLGFRTRKRSSEINYFAGPRLVLSSVHDAWKQTVDKTGTFPDRLPEVPLGPDDTDASQQVFYTWNQKLEFGAKGNPVVAVFKLPIPSASIDPKMFGDQKWFLGITNDGRTIIITGVDPSGQIDHHR